MSLESIAHEIRKEIEKLTGVLHLLERGAKRTTRGNYPLTVGTAII
jgi:hypothetical protein